MVFLSYILDSDTPSYGNRNRFAITKKSDISKGDIANDSFIETTVHIGTHIDMPYHFYDNGQTLEDFDNSFWVFKNIAILEIEPKDLVIKDELLSKLDTTSLDEECEILIVKTGICEKREEEVYWKENYGFHPDVYDYLVQRFPSLRVFGFDSISVSSFQNRMLGREAHKRFLNPKKPILLLEDMDLREVSQDNDFRKIIVAPLRISNCDGLPCTVMGFVND